MGLHRVLEKLTIFAIPSAGVLELVDNPDLGSGGASRGGSSPPTRTRETARPFGRVFAFGYGGTPSVHRYPIPKPLPSGKGLAAEAAVRRTAKSLRSEGASIQCRCSARARVSRLDWQDFGHVNEVRNQTVRKHLQIRQLQNNPFRTSIISGGFGTIDFVDH